jgi:hypothetical protein
MDIDIVKRLSLARHLFELGQTSLRSSNDLQLFSAANLLQDSVEAFLIAVAEYVGAEFDQNTKFDKYFVSIDTKISPKELPFKTKLLRLNRIRVDSKHHGIQPARDECDRVAVSIREFFDEVSQSIFGSPFASISAIMLLDDGDPKNNLLDAKEALEVGKLEECVIGCRKAIYLELESKYDISPFKEGKPVGLLDAFSVAPTYARNKAYIDKHVTNPTDYIVRDHNRIEQDLLLSGADATAFWNIWRLTPEVYRDKDGSWFVKHEFDKLDDKVLVDKAEYIFSTTVDLLLSIHTNRRKTKNKEFGSYFVKLKHDKVPVYEKADINSKLVGNTPDGLLKIDTNFRINGLSDEGPY